MTILIVLAAVVLIMIVVRIFVMLAVGSDADAIGVKNRTLWMVLSFFVPFLAIIYAFVRKDLEKTVPRYCYDCQSTLAPNTRICPSCNSFNVVDMVKADAEQHKKKSRLYAIIAVVIMVIGMIGGIVGGVVVAVKELAPVVSEYGDLFSDYYDYFNDNYSDYDEFDEDDVQDFYEHFFNDSEKYNEFFDDNNLYK